MATIQDIAEEVGISKAAVSRILNHKGSFSQETIKKVERAAKRLNYKNVNMLIQESNKGTEEKRIALVLPMSKSLNYGLTATLIEQAAYEYGYDLLVCSSLYASLGEQEFFEEMRRRNIAGVILATFAKDAAFVAKQGLPVVTVGFKESDDISAIRSDDYSCGKIAAKHLIGRGCKNLLYITTFPDGLKYDDRYRGFREEVEKNHCTVWPYQVEIEMDLQNDAPGIITEMALEHPDADGVFTETFRLTAVLYKTYSDLGYSIPGDIKIVGYGNEYTALYSCPRFTIVKENIQQVALKTVAMLVDNMENEDQTAERHVKEVKIPVSIDVQQTT